MSMVTRAFTSMAVACLIAALGFAGGTASAAPPASKDEAVAMVKKAVAYIKTEGPDKAYPAIDDQAGQFVDRDLYVVVYQLDGKVLAHGADKARIGTNQIDAKDPDGKAFVKERVELAADAAELLAGLQVHEPGEQEGRTQADVLRAARCHRRLRRNLRHLTAGREQGGEMRLTTLVLHVLMVGGASGMSTLAVAAAPSDDPKDIIAAQLRDQGYACDHPQSAEQDIQRLQTR